MKQPISEVFNTVNYLQYTQATRMITLDDVTATLVMEELEPSTSREQKVREQINMRVHEAANLLKEARVLAQHIDDIPLAEKLKTILRTI